MKIKLLFLALCAKGMVIDLITSNNQTYQISGDRRFQGMFERLFPAGSHPIRRQIGRDEAQSALNQANEIRLWTETAQYCTLSVSELEVELAPFPVC